jgi:hypothetical protein
MKETEVDQNLIQAYLLGAVTDEKRTLVEERLFTDRNYFEKALMVEAELQDDFAFDAMTPDERKQFLSRRELVARSEKTFALTRALVDRAQPSASLIERLTNRLNQQFPQRRLVFAFSVIAAIVIAAAGWWLMTRNPTQNEVVRLNQQSPEFAAGDFPLEFGSIRTRSTGRPVDNAEFKIPASVQVVQLRMELDSTSFAAYQVQLIREPDESIFTLDNARLEQRGGRTFLAIRVPARVLTSGAYRLAPTGTAADGHRETLRPASFEIVD